MTEQETLIAKLFANQIKHEEQVYPFSGDTLVGYDVHGTKVWREFRKTGKEIVRNAADKELEGKERNGQLKKLNVGLTSGDSKTTARKD